MKTLLITSILSLGIIGSAFGDDLKEQKATVGTGNTELSAQKVDIKSNQEAKEEKIEKKLPFHAAGALEMRN